MVDLNFSCDFVIGLINKLFIFELCICIILSFYRLFYFYEAVNPTKKMPNTKKKARYAVLIPARNESAVIGNIIKSLKEQTYDKNFFDVYVIVENNNDPTIKITKDAGFNIIIRGDLTNRRTKGYALDDAIQYLFKTKKASKYDAYFVFDADNILTPHYIEELNKAYQAGYQVAMGYRSSRNTNTNWISACSVLTFSQINTFNNKARSKYFNKIGLSGTGFYVNSSIINKEKGWIWNGLTEDAELTYYCVVHDIKCTYLDYIHYYDEQPTDLSTVRNQHKRWIKGYAYTSKKYIGQMKNALIKSKKLYIADYLLTYLTTAIAATTFAFYIIAMSILAVITGKLQKKAILSLIITVVSFLLCVFAYTAVLLFIDREKINITKKLSWKVVFLHPFFMGLYIVHAFFAIFQKKGYEWTEIKHIGQISVS